MSGLKNRCKLRRKNRFCIQESKFEKFACMIWSASISTPYSGKMPPKSLPLSIDWNMANFHLLNRFPPLLGRGGGSSWTDCKGVRNAYTRWAATRTRHGYIHTILKPSVYASLTWSPCVHDFLCAQIAERYNIHASARLHFYAHVPRIVTAYVRQCTCIPAYMYAPRMFTSVPACTQWRARALVLTGPPTVFHR